MSGERDSGRRAARTKDIDAKTDDRLCRYCEDVKSGWVVYEQVGPNLPQRTVTFRCSECELCMSKGVVYWYDE